MREIDQRKSAFGHAIYSHEYYAARSSPKSIWRGSMAGPLTNLEVVFNEAKRQISRTLGLTSPTVCRSSKLEAKESAFCCTAAAVAVMGPVVIIKFTLHRRSFIPKKRCHSRTAGFENRGAPQSKSRCRSRRRCTEIIIHTRIDASKAASNADRSLLDDGILSSEYFAVRHSDSD